MSWVSFRRELPRYRTLLVLMLCSDALAVGDPRNEVGEDDPASPSAQNENFSGKLLQLSVSKTSICVVSVVMHNSDLPKRFFSCHRKKIDSPQYSHQEEGPPNDRTFITTCRVRLLRIVFFFFTKVIGVIYSFHISPKTSSFLSSAL